MTDYFKRVPRRERGAAEGRVHIDDDVADLSSLSPLQTRLPAMAFRGRSTVVLSKRTADPAAGPMGCREPWADSLVRACKTFRSISKETVSGAGVVKGTIGGAVSTAS